MPVDGYGAAMVKMQKAGAALASSASEVSLLDASGKLTMAGLYLQYVGQQFRLTAAGKISTVVTTPGTMTMKLKAGSTAVLTSQAFPLNIIAKTNVSWYLDLLVTVRAAAGVMTLMANGLWTSEATIASAAPAAGPVGAQPWQVSAPAVGSSFDNTIANVIDFTGQWSVNSGSNSITCEQYTLVSLD